MDKALSLAARRTAEMAAVFMIGDGLLGLVLPRSHVDLWRSEVAPVDALMKPFQDHPGRRRLYGLVQMGAGLALARLVAGRVEKPVPGPSDSPALPELVEGLLFLLETGKQAFDRLGTNGRWIDREAGERGSTALGSACPTTAISRTD